jgi:hypothetical protein
MYEVMMRIKRKGRAWVAFGVQGMGCYGLRWDSWEGQMRRNGCRRNQNSHGQQRS